MNTDNISVGEQIETLIKLQEIDAEIYRLNREKAQKPEELNESRAAFKEKEDRLKDLDNEAKALQVKRKEKELELADKEEKIKKLQVQLYQVKTNKDYTAMQHEIAGIKADSSLIEDEIIRLLEGSDNVDAEIKRQKASLAECERHLKDVEAKIAGELKLIEEGLSKLNAQREELIKSILPNIRSRYERILKNKDGLAMVAADSGACGGCHMTLPPQVINEVRMKKDIVTCEMCTRILYMKE